jgi:hypothetical protein
MQSPYTKAVIQGLVVSGLVLGFAGTAGVVLVLAIGLTQAGFLVTWLPLVFLAFFTIVVMAVLHREACSWEKEHPEKTLE